MKTTKYIWLAVLGISLLSFTVKAQENNSYDKTVSTVSKGVSTVYDDLKSTAPKIEKALTSLGKELKVGVNAVWDILVRQQLVWSIAFLILTLSAITNWFMFYKRYLHLKVSEDTVKVLERNRLTTEEYPNPDYNKYSSDPHRLIPTLKREIGTDAKEQFIETIQNKNLDNFKYPHLIICMILSCFSFYHFNDMLTGFINPEFGAMKTIAEIASQIK